MALIRTLYKALLRPAAELSALGEPLRVRLPVLSSSSQWLQGSTQYEKDPPTPEQIIRALFPFLMNDDTLSGDNLNEIAPSTLRQIVRRRFRDKEGDVEERIDTAFSALRTLSEQLDLARCTVATRSGIEGTALICVEASSHFCGKTEHEPNSWLWLFQYRIRIRNEGQLPVQLLSREWTIRTIDGTIQAQVPRGSRGSSGVVGQQPILKPGESFEYASGTGLPLSRGSIEGSFQMAIMSGIPGVPGKDGHNGSFDAKVGCVPLRAHGEE